jgi:hypothetical protein
MSSYSLVGSSIFECLVRVILTVLLFRYHIHALTIITLNKSVISCPHGAQQEDYSLLESDTV